MKKALTSFALGLILLAPTFSFAKDMDTSGLYATWCLTGMSTKIDGARTPDKSSYTFTKDNILKYDAGVFKQEGKFTIANARIKTKAMGNYKIISIKEDEMVLRYGTYMFFSKGRCK